MNLRVDYLKIDSSLIKEVDTDPQARTVVSSIQAFADRLNLGTVAEFVHSADVQETVVDLGVAYSQGYFIGKPDPRPRAAAEMNRP